MSPVEGEVHCLLYIVANSESEVTQDELKERLDFAIKLKPVIYSNKGGKTLFDSSKSRQYSRRDSNP
ncbi:unnamed protein product [Protopolystoma xenopodis]|uniref:Uncharacterized protein n=1 Tax=Protopolystoma xenopodis TaxID=117903 RepID=A0A3S5BG85_9PLAT|nr:unnamed protein product [Protopolystoma xenopodis]